MIAPPFIVVPLAAMIGAVAASCLTTSVIRHLRFEQSTAGRSHCDHCHTPLPYAQTAPILSYVLQSGVCLTCREPIDPMHLGGEVVGALIGASSALVCLWHGALEAVPLAAVGASLLALSLHDLRTLRLPNPLVGVVLVCALALGLLQGVDRLEANVVWAVGTLAVLAGLRFAYARTRGSAGLGLGDVKLLAALAVWLGPLLPSALVIACLLALMGRVLTGAVNGRAPFGPWIAIGAWIVGVGAELVSWPL